jgi:hypothetical protein
MRSISYTEECDLPGIIYYMFYVVYEMVLYGRIIKYGQVGSRWRTLLSKGLLLNIGWIALHLAGPCTSSDSLRTFMMFDVSLSVMNQIVLTATDWFVTPLAQNIPKPTRLVE